MMQYVPGYLNPILAESIGGLPENHKVLCHSEVATVSLLEVRYERRSKPKMCLSILLDGLIAEFRELCIRQQYERLLWYGIPYN